MKRKSGLSSTVRLRVLKRDKFQCTYCGKAGTEAELEVDHVIALARGGSHHMSNLTTACRACNQKKSDGAAPRRAYTGLIGMFVHTFKDGEIEGQGEIIAMDGETALVQWFEWLCGGPIFVGPLAKSEIYANCKLYANAKLMNRAYDEEIRRQHRQNGEGPYRRSGGTQEADSGI